MALPKIVKDIEARVRDTGDALTGTLTWPGNVVALNFRTGHASYDGTITYQTSGNEALVFGTKQGVTSFIFVNGEDTITNNSATRWTSLTSPGLQIKNNCVSIGQLWGDTVTPDYKLKVVGNTYLNGSVTVEGALTATGSITASTFIGTLQGNSDTTTKIAYPAQLTSDSAIDNFNAANRFQVGTWNSTSSPGVSNGIIVNFGWTSTSFGAQMAIDDDPTYYLSLRQRDGNGWKAWKRIPMGDGTGASGTWGISISGSAAIASEARTLCSDASMKLYAQLNNEINFGGTNASTTIYFGYRAADSKPIPTSFIFGGSTGTATITASKVYGAVWNDYAEYRIAESIEPGRCIIEHKSGKMKLSTERLQPGAEIISDTFGFAIGKSEESKTPIAASGRVLAYPNEDRHSYPLGCAVCSGPNGTVSQMTREEIREYPERIIGTVSEIPDYETWGAGNVPVNGRIWIRIK